MDMRTMNQNSNIAPGKQTRRPVVVEVGAATGQQPASDAGVPSSPSMPDRPPHLDPLHASVKPPSGFQDAVREGKAFKAYTHPQLEREEAVLRVKDFSLYYGQSRALWDINMIFARGKTTALIGPSGCGKSTLLRSINRLNDLIDSVRCTGEMILNGRSVYAPNVDVIDVRKRIGMVFQKSNPFPMSIFENVVYSLRIDGERRKSVLDEACERALRGAALWDEVKDRLNQSALGMSGGQQQRLCIARAIAAEPEVLLMDEPCSALDPIATLKVEEFIREIAGRITVVIVTHNMQQAARVSNYTAFMYLGRLVEYGRTGDIFQNPQVPETENYVTGRFG
jgi:phosphate transport system ATP-binding protein